MAIPLILLGSAIVGAGMLAEDRARRQKIELRRRLNIPQKAGILEPRLIQEPSLYEQNFLRVKPVPGSIICCFVFGVIEHSGIWLGEDTIIELHGSGLIRAVSVQRFLAGRSGNNIFIACDAHHQPLVSSHCLEAASNQIFSYRDYDLFDNNCHRFVWECLTNESVAIASFETLSQKMAVHFKKSIYWDQIERSPFVSGEIT